MGAGAPSVVIHVNETGNLLWLFQKKLARLIFVLIQKTDPSRLTHLSPYHPVAATSPVARPTQPKGPRACHTPHHHSAMLGETGYQTRGIVIATKIYSLLRSLKPATYDEISPKVGYWIEYALTEQSVTADELADQLSSTMWDVRDSNTDVARFFKEFHDAPHRSKQARSFIDSFCSRVLLTFAAASAEDLGKWYTNSTFKIATTGGEGFVRAASLVGHLIECGVLDRKLVRRHLIKPLIAHHYTDRDCVPQKYYRVAAIFQLLTAAGDTLLQRLLDPEDVQVCFETLNSEIPSGRVPGLDAEKLQVRYAPCSGTPHHDPIFLFRGSVEPTPDI